MKLPTGLAQTLAQVYGVTDLVFKEVEKFSICNTARGLSVEATTIYRTIGGSEGQTFRTYVCFVFTPDSLKATYATMPIRPTNVWSWKTMDGVGSGDVGFAEELAKQVLNHLTGDFAEYARKAVSQISLPAQTKRRPIWQMSGRSWRSGQSTRTR